MSDDIKLSFEQDHIRVTLACGYEFDPARSPELWNELTRLCRENGTCRVLVEGRAPEVEPDTPEIIASGQRAAAVPKMWMAFVFEDFVPNEKSELFEVIAASKGVRVKHFSDREHALRWLRHNSPS